MNLRKSATFVLFAVRCSLFTALAGCALGVNYRRPALELPERWSQSGMVWKQAQPRDEEPRGAWWELFGDPALNALAEQAVLANQDLQAAMARLQQARATARMEMSELFPEVEFGPSSERFRRTRSSFGGAGGFTRSQYNLPWDLSYEVDLWGRVRRSFEAAGAQAQAQAAAYHSVLLTLTADVAQHYFSIREMDAELEALERTVRLRQDAQGLVARRYRAGVVSELDLTRADTELAKAQARLMDANRRRKEFEHALAVLCGKPPPTFSVERSPLDLSLPSVPVGVPSDLLERRPDVAEAERRMEAANARIGVAQAAFFPVVSLTGSIGWQNARLEDWVTADSKIWSLGEALTLPVFNAGRNRALLEAARARYDEEVARYRQQVLEAMKEVENALSNVSLRAEQAKVQQEVVTAAVKSAELSQARYAQGLVNYLEVVDAERSRLEAELDSIRLVNEQLLSTVLLVKALGGGWESAASQGRSRAITAALEQARILRDNR